MSNMTINNIAIKVSTSSGVTSSVFCHDIPRMESLQVGYDIWCLVIPWLTP